MLGQIHHKGSRKISFLKAILFKEFYLEVLVSLHVRKVYIRKGYKTVHRFPYPYNLALLLRSKTRAEKT